MYKRLSIAALLAVSGILFFLVQVDRMFINLPPTEGIINTTPLLAQETYEQYFIVNNTNISRLGVYVRPIVDTPPEGSFTVMLSRGEDVLVSEQVPAVFTAPDTPSTLRFSPPIQATLGEELKITIRVPQDLSQKLGVQTRIQDESFNTDARFFLDSVKQENPIGYVVFYTTKPPLSVYGGSLLVLAGLLYATKTSLMSRRGKYAYAVLLPIIANIPLLYTGEASYLVIAIQIAVIYAILHWGKAFRFSLPTRLFMAHVMAFSSWIPLLLIVGRGLEISPGLSQAKDIFLDPNQIALDIFGAYVGIPVAVFAVVGLLTTFQPSKPHRLLLIISFLLVIAGIFLFAPVGAIGIACLAGIGFEAGLTFLGKQDRLVRILAYTLIYLILIDILVVYSRVIEPQYSNYVLDRFV